MNPATFGVMPSTMPPGFLKAVHFPVLAMLDTTTGDHRRLFGEGGRTRNLPLTIRTQPANLGGHEGAVPSGALFQVTFDYDTKVLSGDGFLIDDEMGRKTALYIATQVMNKNSIDLAEIKARFVEDLESEDYWVEFYEWALSATTIVATPAFAEADGVYVDETTAALLDETMASLLVDPMAPLEVRVENPPTFTFHDAVELVADGLPTTPYDAYFVPEAPKPHKLRTDGKRVWGHLGKWNTCHDGLPSCTKIPRPRDNYASFNKSGAFTEQGQIQTGPIFALGGHRSLLGLPSDVTEAQAYGGIENAWADVRVTPGVHGPWLSGHIRPGVAPEVAYAGVASRISGHWVGDRLKAIVSVSAEGFDQTDEDLETQASYIEFAVADDGTVELVASFGPCDAETDEHAATVSLSAFDLDELAALVAARLSQPEFVSVTVEQADGITHVTPERSRIALALLLAEDDEDDIGFD